MRILFEDYVYDTKDVQDIGRRDGTIREGRTGLHKVVLLNHNLTRQGNQVTLHVTLLRGDDNLTITTLDLTECYLTIDLRYDCGVRRVTSLEELCNTGKTSGDITCTTPLTMYDAIADTVHDPLMLTCTAVCDGENVALLMSADLKGINVSLATNSRNMLEKEFGKTGFCKCSQAVCTRKEAFPVRYKNIRQLDITYLDYIMENYSSSEEHMKERLNAGVMYGAFEEDRIIGFIGMHNEGSMGMLFVEEEYRHKGIGASLESYLINLQISNGFTPYCHIIEGNEKSLALQEKLGLYLADTPLWWIWK